MSKMFQTKIRGEFAKLDADKSGFITKGLMTNEMLEIVTNI